MKLLPAGWQLTGVLVLCCAGLAGLLAAQWRGQAPPLATGTVDAEPLAGPGAPAGPLPARYQPPALAAFDEILERPLFIPDRRPEKPPEPAAPPPPPAELLNVRLEGIARVGESRIAVLRDLQTNQGLRISQGMEYQGWKLETLDRDKAVLTRNGQVQELKLERK